MGRVYLCQFCMFSVAYWISRGLGRSKGHCCGLCLSVFFEETGFVVERRMTRAGRDKVLLRFELSAQVSDQESRAPRGTTAYIVPVVLATQHLLICLAKRF